MEPPKISVDGKPVAAPASVYRHNSIKTIADQVCHICSGSKIDSLIHKTLHPSHKCHPHHHITHHDSRDGAESGNNFAGTNPDPTLDAAGHAANDFTGTNPRPASRDDGNNNFTGLSPAEPCNNFPGTNPRSWAQRHPESRSVSAITSPASSCVTSDNEGEAPSSSSSSSRRKRMHRPAREEREEEDGNNFPGMNPSKKKSFWGFSGREWEEGNNFPGTNPNNNRW